MSTGPHGDHAAALRSALALIRMLREQYDEERERNRRRSRQPGEINAGFVASVAKRVGLLKGFYTGETFAHADPAFRRDLQRLGISTAHQLGNRLALIVDVDLNGLRVMRRGNGNRGTRWMIEPVGSDSDTSSVTRSQAAR
jgi:hypothetical protein